MLSGFCLTFPQTSGRCGPSYQSSPVQPWKRSQRPSRCISSSTFLLGKRIRLQNQKSFNAIERFFHVRAENGLEKQIESKISALWDDEVVLDTAAEIVSTETDLISNIFDDRPEEEENMLLLESVRSASDYESDLVFNIFSEKPEDAFDLYLGDASKSGFDNDGEEKASLVAMGRRDGPKRSGMEPALGGLLTQRAVIVDELTCIGCYNCAMVARNTFFIEPDYGRARAYRQDGDVGDVVQEAIDTCPVECISWVSFGDLKKLRHEMDQAARVDVGALGDTAARYRRKIQH